MEVNPVAARAFDAAAEDYERGRPGWPADAIAGLLERFGARRVLDLAAGTGKLTRVLAELADDVVAVEPVDGMRRVLESQLPQVRVLPGTAEAIPLADGAVDAVFVAEAFHWFDPLPAAAELARVLKPGGGLVVLWNRPGWERLEWVDEIDAIIEPHHPATPRAETAPWREALEAEERFGPLRDEETTHEHSSDREHLLAMLASFSWIADLPGDARTTLLAACREVLERHGVDAVTLTYKTLIATTRRIDG